MFERILVPLDGSQTAETILAQVHRLLKREDALVTLLRAIDLELPPRMDTTGLRDERSDDARAYLEGVSKALDAAGIRVRTMTRIGPAADSILSAAEELDTQLIAMSTHGRTGIARWVYGSVAEKVLRAAKAPLLLVRSFVAGPKGGYAFRKIVLPVDGSDLALAVRPIATDLARRFGATIIVLHVAEPRADFSRCWEMTQSAAAALAAEGIPGTNVLRRGDVAGEILAVAAEHEADLVVMSTHGRSGTSRWALGSVAEKVLRASTVPMLVLPAAALPAPRAAAGAGASK